MSETPAGDVQCRVHNPGREQAGLQPARRNAPTEGILTATASSESGTTVVKAGEALACRAERGSIFPDAEVAARPGAARQGARRRPPKPRSATTAAAVMAALRTAAIVEYSGCGGVGEEEEEEEERGANFGRKSEDRGVPCAACRAPPCVHESRAYRVNLRNAQWPPSVHRR
jgi:hypothetical protein